MVFFDGDSVLCDVMKGIRRFVMWFRRGRNMNLYSVSHLPSFENVGKETSRKKNRHDITDCGKYPIKNTGMCRKNAKAL